MPTTIMDTQFEPYKKAVELRIAALEKKVLVQAKEIEQIKKLLAGNGMVWISG